LSKITNWAFIAQKFPSSDEVSAIFCCTVNDEFYDVIGELV